MQYSADSSVEQIARSMSKGHVPAIVFVGPSGSGKTTIAESVIQFLTAQGFKVGAFKHHGKMSFDIDHEGKDSYRFTQAGSVHTVISAPGKIASIQKIDHEADFLELIKQMDDCEIVIGEGYRHAGLPAIEVIRYGHEEPERLGDRPSLDRDETLAIATDYSPDDVRPFACERHVLDLDDVEEIADFIVKVFGLVSVMPDALNMYDERRSH